MLDTAEAFSTSRLDHLRPGIAILPQIPGRSPAIVPARGSRRQGLRIGSWGALLLCWAPAASAAYPLAVEAQHGMVVTAQRLASEVGFNRVRPGLG